MGILRLGNPNSKIVEEIKRRHEQPVTVKKLKMTSTAGVIQEFDYNEVPQPLAFVERGSSIIVKEPFASNPNFPTKFSIANVEDTGKQITAIAENAFYQCYNLTSIDCQAVTEISDSAFTKCDLQNVNLSSVQLIANGSFTECKKLSCLNFPELKSTGYGAMQKCSLLTSINCPNISSIGQNTFNECSSLQEVIISSMDVNNLTLLRGILAFGAKRDWPVSVYVPEECIEPLLAVESPKITWSGLVENRTIELVGV